MTLSQPANRAGWNNTDVTVMLNATDGEGTGVHEIVYLVNDSVFQTFESSVAIPIASEGITTVKWFAKDRAGNSEVPQILTLKIDKTPPVIDAGRSPAANANDWNNTDVVASYTATDPLSGFVSGGTDTGAFTFTAEGVGQVHTFTVTDLAGNSASATVGNVNIDKTGPSIIALRSPQSNANGWNNTNVTVSFSGSDLLSGLETVSGPVTVTTEGANQIVTGTATDRAGNSSFTTVALNIDKTAPELLVQFEIARKDVQVIGRDGLSGASTEPIAPLSVSPPPGRHEHDDDDDDGHMERRIYRVADLAGNTLTIVLKIKRDGRELHARIISWAYKSGPANGGNPLFLNAPRNRFEVEWKTRRDGVLTELEQTLEINSGRERQTVEADYNAYRNETTIKVDDLRHPIVRSGLVLLKLSTNQSKLRIEY